MVSIFCSWHPSIPLSLCCSFLSPSDALQLLLLWSASLLGQGGVVSGEACPRAGTWHLCVVGLRLGDVVHARGHNKPPRLGAWPCRSSRRGGLGKASALPGLCGGAALWTLLYHCVELTLSAVRAFSWNHSNDVSVCKSDLVDDDSRACSVQLQSPC